MRDLVRKMRAGILFAMLFVAVVLAGPAPAQGPGGGGGNLDPPQWMKDSFIARNRYLRIWEYFRGEHITRFNIWTQEGDPLDTGDDFFFAFERDDNGVPTAYIPPWGSRLWSSVRDPEDARPYANHLTLHVEDPTATETGGFRNYQLPEDGRPQFAPPIVGLENGQGFAAPFFFPEDATAGSPINLKVTQRLVFARDLIRVEIAIQNQSGSSRRVGARMLLDSYVDFWGPTRSVFIPDTRQRLLFETEFRAANMPTEWLLFDDDLGPDPEYVSKQILRGSGATTPSRIIFGNTLDMFPFVFANERYDWVSRPDFELRISDIGALMYWDPVLVPAGQTRSFVTFIGVGVASHEMSEAYLRTQNQNSGEIPQGFIGAVQTPFALPLINGNADLQNHTLTAYQQNANLEFMPGGFAFIELPVGLEFGGNDPNQPLRRSLGSLSPVGTPGDEGQDDWTFRANGIEAGELPINITFGNAFGDTSRVRRLVNVPQGRRYQLREDWMMFTFPFTFSTLENDPAVVFETLNGQPLPAGSVQVVRYNPLTNEYQQVTEIQAGEGYWVRTTVPGPINGATQVRLTSEAKAIEVGSPQNEAESVTRLVRGWNQIGNPSPYTVRLSQLRFQQDAGPVLVNFETAVSRQLIRPGLYDYDRITRTYRKLDINSQLRPGHGFWIYSNRERDVYWPQPIGPGLSITNPGSTTVPGGGR